jgi:hypothetical protein
MVDLNTTHQMAQAAVQAGDGISQWSINLISILMFLLIIVTLGFIWAMGKMSRYVSATIEREFKLLRDGLSDIAQKVESLGATFTEHEKNDTARHHALREKVVALETEMSFVERRRGAPRGD